MRRLTVVSAPTTVLRKHAAQSFRCFETRLADRFIVLNYFELNNFVILGTQLLGPFVLFACLSRKLASCVVYVDQMSVELSSMSFPERSLSASRAKLF